MTKKIPFSLNQIILPGSSFDDFLLLAKKLDVKAIEIRNDIATNLIEENNPNRIKDICEENSVKIISINALQKFDIWNTDRAKEFVTLCDYASTANVEAIVLVPLNDGSVIDSKEYRELLQNSLKSIVSILNNYNLLSYVEPLGFKTATLRKKSIASEIIHELQTSKLKIVHDTFHHTLSNEKEFFTPITGLVHISGVSKEYSNENLKDGHRSYINENDILDNIGQIKKMIKANYQGFFSFEPFAEEILKNNNSSDKIKESFDYILTKLF